MRSVEQRQRCDGCGTGQYHRHHLVSAAARVGRTCFILLLGRVVSIIQFGALLLAHTVGAD